MAEEKRTSGAGRDLSDVVSVIGAGMEIVGDVESDGTVRVEGTVDGSIRAAKSVVIGKDGVVDGDIETQDVVVAGRVTGTISAESRVELQASCRVEGDIRSRRVKLDEGGRMEGRLHMGADAFGSASGRDSTASPGRSARPSAEGGRRAMPAGPSKRG